MARSPNTAFQTAFKLRWPSVTSCEEARRIFSLSCQIIRSTCAVRKLKCAGSNAILLKFAIALFDSSIIQSRRSVPLVAVASVSEIETKSQSKAPKTSNENATCDVGVSALGMVGTEASSASGKFLAEGKRLRAREPHQIPSQRDNTMSKFGVLVMGPAGAGKVSSLLNPQ